MITHKKWTLAALSVAAGIAAINTASANTVSGTIWETTTGIAQDAVPGNVPPSMTPGTAGATFTAPSNPLSFNPTDNSAVYTLGAWFASAGATGAYFGGAAPTDTLDATITNITGTVSVTTGETFSVSHDDGVTLIIGGLTVISDPGPTSVIDLRRPILERPAICRSNLSTASAAAPRPLWLSTCRLTRQGPRNCRHGE